MTAQEAKAKARLPKRKLKQKRSQTRSRKIYRSNEKTKLAFLLLLQEAGLPRPESECRFCTRLWRFDYCWPEIGLAVECEGGIWIRGRHNSPKGMLKDMEKYNAAAEYGWTLLRYTPQDLVTIPCIQQIGAVIKMLKERGEFDRSLFLKMLAKGKKKKAARILKPKE